MNKTLSAFTNQEFLEAKNLLAAKIASMLGRKMEEDDWSFVYCNSKNIPIKDWSNLHIDINHNGLGVEQKMLRITKDGSIKNECGTTKMHPSGTRSIRIPIETDPNAAMRSILSQYHDLIETRTNTVRKIAGKQSVDMRIGWLLWKDSLDEFLYFEEPMVKPVINNYKAEWNITPARGARKQSRSLWIYEKSTGKKKFSITTEAGAKIQPYFDVPPPNDMNLYYFQVQGYSIAGGLVEIWLTKSTAKYLELLYGSLDTQVISKAIEDYSPTENPSKTGSALRGIDIAVKIIITESAYQK